MYADGGNISNELTMLNYVREFGAYAVFGRPVLGYGEMRRMRHAEFVLLSYQARKRASNWQAWAKDNPDAAEMLVDAQKLAKELLNWE